MTAYKTIIARNGATTMLATVEEDGAVYERLTWDAEACLSLGDAWDSLVELTSQGWQWERYELPQLHTRRTYHAACERMSLDPEEEERNQIRRLPREVLPACALAVLADPGATTAEYWRWLTERVQVDATWEALALEDDDDDEDE